MFVRYLIYIYVANKDFSELLNILEKQLNRINAKMEQNNNYNSYCCPSSVGHLLIKLLFLMRPPAGFCSFFFPLSTSYFND